MKKNIKITDKEELKIIEWLNKQERFRIIRESRNFQRKNGEQ